MTGACATDAVGVVDAVLRSRRSVRAFKPDAVPLALVEDILSVASSAPSNSNTQPWHVHAVAGAPMEALGDALVAAFRESRLPPSAHFPDPLPDAYAARQRDFGARYYSALEIDAADLQRRMHQTEKNFRFFGAPVGLIFTIDRRLAAHSWLDVGMFLQNVMIAASARGLGTCPQVSFARFHPVLAQHLGMGMQELTVCGMSLGHPIPDAAVNGLVMPRRPLQAFSSFDLFAAPTLAA